MRVEASRRVLAVLSWLEKDYVTFTFAGGFVKLQCGRYSVEGRELEPMIERLAGELRERVVQRARAKQTEMHDANDALQLLNAAERDL